MKLLRYIRLFSLSRLILGSLVLAVASPFQSITYAINTFYSGNNIEFYDPNASDSCSTDSGTSAVSGDSSGAFSLTQVKSFASVSITSTWNIPNSTVEPWFLKQAGAQSTIKKYGLTSGNIGQITSAVTTAEVSPVFFYLYVVNEGGGAGGFINHYPSDIAGGGPANAKRDAKYLASQAQQTNGTPATGGGEPADMPTAEAKQILDSLPAGSVGRAYIPATSAVTAELENLSGKTGDWTGKFNSPLSDAMQNIKRMGGDPTQGGTSVASESCANNVTGEGMAKGISWAKMIANNNGYGYDQPTRTTGWAKWQSDPGCTNQCGSFDCSSFVSAILTVAGYYKTNPEFAANEGSEGASLRQAGFTKVASSAATSKDLEPGDILLKNGVHTEMYIGNNQNAGAHHNENGGVSGGKVGDQTGDEISIRPFYNDGWTAVYRAPSS